MIPLDGVSPKILKIIAIAAEKEYSEALSSIDEYTSETEEGSPKNISAMISLQVLALAG